MVSKFLLRAFAFIQKWFLFANNTQTCWHFVFLNLSPSFACALLQVQACIGPLVFLFHGFSFLHQSFELKVSCKGKEGIEIVLKDFHLTKVWEVNDSTQVLKLESLHIDQRVRMVIPLQQIVEEWTC